MLDNLQDQMDYSHSTYFPTLDIRKETSYAHTTYRKTNEVPKAIQKTEPLTNYPKYAWRLKLDSSGQPQFENYYTISRHWSPHAETTDNICPYGDEPAPIARIEKNRSVRKKSISAEKSETLIRSQL